MNAFGAELHGATNAPPLFPDGINIGVNVPIAVIGNGFGNNVDNVTTVGTQNVGGDFSHHDDNPYIGPINVGVNVATVVGGNGFENHLGDITTAANQIIGH
jgi:hypothetical protein